MISYEIHTFQEGGWKTDSVFDSRELALHEAKKMVEGGRHSSLQVFEEVYDEETNKTTARRIFKGGRVTENSSKKAPAKGDKGSASGGAAKDRAGNARRAAHPEKRTSLVLPVTVLSLIVAVGLAALIGLRYFT